MTTPADTAAPISAEGKTIFFTGATGYIGGTVLTALIGLSAPPSKITCLIRDPKKIELLKDVSVSAKTQLEGIQGSLSDVDVIVKAASEADIVVSCADCDDMTSIKAMLEGMKKRKKATGHRSLFIHTTGTAMFCDGAKGNYPNDKIYTDLNPTPATAKTPALLSIATLPESAWHRECDLAILAADATSGCKAYFIAPSTIWGEPKGQVFDIGFSNPFSQQMPNLIKAALDRGEAGMIGKGANIWPHVAISDLAELYKLVFAGAQRGNIGHGASGFYLGISGEYTWRTAASSIGAALVDNKWAKTSQPSTFSHEEVLKYFGDTGESICGGNSRGVADRSKSIGWRPKLNEIEDFVGDLKKEADRYQKVKGSKA